VGGGGDDWHGNANAMVRTERRIEIVRDSGRCCQSGGSAGIPGVDVNEGIESMYGGPVEFRALIVSEIDRLGKIVKLSGAQLE
jgi:hypothetical protein